MKNFEKSFDAYEKLKKSDTDKSSEKYKKQETEFQQKEAIFLDNLRMDFEKRRIDDLQAGLGQFSGFEIKQNVMILKAFEKTLSNFEGDGEGIDISNEAKEKTKQYFKFVKA